MTIKGCSCFSSQKLKGINFTDFGINSEVMRWFNCWRSIPMLCEVGLDLRGRPWGNTWECQHTGALQFLWDVTLVASEMATHC